MRLSLNTAVTSSRTPRIGESSIERSSPTFPCCAMMHVPTWMWRLKFQAVPHWCLSTRLGEKKEQMNEASFFPLHLKSLPLFCSIAHLTVLHGNDCFQLANSLHGSQDWHIPSLHTRFLLTAVVYTAPVLWMSWASVCNAVSHTPFMITNKEKTWRG